MGLFIFNIAGVLVNILAMVTNAGQRPEWMIINAAGAIVCLFYAITSFKRA